MHPSDVVLRFLESIGRPTEAEFYLREFRAERRQSFAIISVSASAMRLSADALAFDLRFLSTLGLAPVLVFGLASPAEGQPAAERLREKLRADVPCAVARPDDAGARAAEGAIPLVPLDEPPGGDAPSLDRRFDRLADLADALETRKLVFVGRRSGLQRKSGETVSLVNIQTDAEGLRRPGELPRKQAALLSQIERILRRAPRGLTVAVTSPVDLLRELFTERGAGTLLRRGARIASYSSLGDLDPERLRQLLVSAFGREPGPRVFSQRVARALVADDYRGAAVIAEAPLAPYLSKFAVDPRARGEGLGRDLWRAVTAEFPTLFWRSRRDNPFTSWYMRHCDGMAVAGPWCVFWRGLPESKILDAIAYARGAPDDFEDGDAGAPPGADRS